MEVHEALKLHRWQIVLATSEKNIIIVCAMIYSMQTTSFDECPGRGLRNWMQFKLKVLRNNDKANRADGRKSCFVLLGRLKRSEGFMTRKMNCDKEVRVGERVLRWLKMIWVNEMRREGGWKVCRVVEVDGVSQGVIRDFRKCNWAWGCWFVLFVTTLGKKTRKRTQETMHFKVRPSEVRSFDFEVMWITASIIFCLIQFQLPSFLYLSFLQVSLYIHPSNIRSSNIHLTSNIPLNL
jgi:hypothetical protein